MCCAADHCQENVYCAHSYCPFILANMAEEEVGRFVVGNDSGVYKFCFAGHDVPRGCSVSVGHDSGMCQAGSPGGDDSRADAFLVGTDMCKAGFVGGDAVGNGSGTCKRRKCSLLDDLDMIPELKSGYRVLTVDHVDQRSDFLGTRSEQDYLLFAHQGRDLPQSIRPYDSGVCVRSLVGQ